jgi:hypothetical protein
MKQMAAKRPTSCLEDACGTATRHTSNCLSQPCVYHLSIVTTFLLLLLLLQAIKKPT